MIGDVGCDVADSASQEQQCQAVDVLRRRLKSFSDEYASDEDGQRFEAIKLGGIGARLPSLEVCQPLARVVIIEPAEAPRFAGK